MEVLSSVLGLCGAAGGPGCKTGENVCSQK